MIASVTRGDLIDLTYEGHIAVSDADGKLLYFQGDPNRLTFARSSTKPFQAATAILSGAVDAYGIDEEELALMCGSHTGTPQHLHVLTRLMEKASLTEDLLQCGAHAPFDRAARKALSSPPSALHNNCSAKHAGMLMSAKYMEEDLSTYTDFHHPHQQRITHLLSELCDAPLEQFHCGIDGCGVPVHALPLHMFATAFARLSHPDSLRPELRDALLRVAAAMRTFPVMVSGNGFICTMLMEHFSDRLVAKGGANAFYAVSLPKQGWGLVIKVESGAASLLPGILLHALKDLGVIEDHEMDPFRSMMQEEIKNHRGDVVGRTRYHIDLQVKR
jgi:L-asparaginase II